MYKHNYLSLQRVPKLLNYWRSWTWVVFVQIVIHGLPALHFMHNGATSERFSNVESKLSPPLISGLWTGRKGVCSWHTYSDNYQLSQGRLDAIFRLWKGKQAGCLHYTEQESNSWVIPGAGGVLHLYSCFWYNLDWSQGCRFGMGKSFISLIFLFLFPPLFLNQKYPIANGYRIKYAKSGMCLILLVRPFMTTMEKGCFSL